MLIITMNDCRCVDTGSDDATHFESLWRRMHDRDKNNGECVHVRAVDV